MDWDASFVRTETAKRLQLKTQENKKKIRLESR